jgi:hypothetical protein
MISETSFGNPSISFKIPSKSFYDNFPESESEEDLVVVVVEDFSLVLELLLGISLTTKSAKAEAYAPPPCPDLGIIFIRNNYMYNFLD